MNNKLNVNKHDIEANIENIKKDRTVKTIAKSLVVLIPLSGALKESPKVSAKRPPKDYGNIEMLEDESTIINVPQIYRKKLFPSKENVTIKDLESLRELTFEMLDGSDISWLNYCTNLETLAIYYETENKPNFKEIKDLKNLKMFSLMGFGATAEFTKEDFSFLKNTPEDKSIFLQETAIASGALDGIKARSLYLYYCSDYGIDYKKLNNVEYLNIDGKVYDLATYFTLEDYKTLVDSGVIVNIPPEIEKEYFEINKRLDAIVESLGVEKTDSDIDKLNAILCYVTENLEYDKEISSLNDHQGHFEDKIADFYLNGRLYGALEKDTAICGNYAALVDALAVRIGLDTKLLTSEEHAWNLVKIDGEDYYVDAAILDQTLFLPKQEEIILPNGNKKTVMTKEKIPMKNLIDNGTIGNYDWYIESPINYPTEQNKLHEPNNVPSFMKIKPYVEKETSNSHAKESLTGKTLVEIELETESGLNKWVVPAAVAIGVMVSLGGAVEAKRHKNNKKHQSMFKTLIDENLTDEDFFNNCNQEINHHNK